VPVGVGMCAVIDPSGSPAQNGAVEVLVALAGFIAYFVISLVVGDRFPFSKHSMYASTAVRNESGAVPLLLAGGKPAAVDRYERFQGLDPDKLYPDGLPCSLEWQIHEAGRWIRDKAAPDGDAPGPVKVEWGFVIVKARKDGRLTERWFALQEGTAWPR